MTTPEAVPAIAEQDARDDIARIYAEIRATVGIVNLIWRHMATIEGALPWAWSVLGPAYASGAVGECADRLRNATQSLLPVTTPLPNEVLRCVGLDETDRQSIAAIVGSYDRGNASNLVATTALLNVGNARQQAGEVPAKRADTDVGTRIRQPAPGTPTDLPVLAPILTLADLDEKTATLVMRLNGLCSTHDTPILVSIYRHLGHWPAFLTLAWMQLSPLAQDGRLSACAARVDHLAAEQAGRLASTLPAGIGHPEGERALARFLQRIGLHRMVAVTALHSALLGR